MTSSPSSSPVRYNLAQIMKAKRAIENDLAIACYVGTRPEGDEFEGLVRRFQDRLPGADREALRRSLLEITGRPITREMIGAAAWRLAGNMPALKEGRAVPPWTRQTAPEWVPLQVIDVKPWITARGRRGSMLQFRVLAGSPCSLKIEKFWSREFAAVAARRLGFTRPRRGKYPFQQTTQLVGLRLMALIDPAASRDGPGFEEVAEARSSILAYNRALLKARSPEFRECPQGFPREHPCHLCPVGMDRCPLAVHRRTYVNRKCRKGCGLVKLHDPATREDLCLECQFQRVKEQQGHKEAPREDAS